MTKDEDDHTRVDIHRACPPIALPQPPPEMESTMHDNNGWEEDDDYMDDDGGYCQRCDNQGFIVTCIDDMCRGCGECMHGDGETVCPDCHGDSAW